MTSADITEHGTQICNYGSSKILRRSKNDLGEWDLYNIWLCWRYISSYSHFESPLLVYNLFFIITRDQWPLEVAVWHLSHGWSQLLQDRVHLLWTWAWPSLVSTSLKLKMTFKFWALRRRLGEVFLVVPLNFSWKYWNHPWPFLTHTNSYCIHLTTLDSLKYSLMSFL